jgi:hypothetical protein
MSQIKGEFNKGNTFSSYYGATSGIPASGRMSVSDFYGKSDAIPPFHLTSWGTLAKANWVITKTKQCWYGIQTGVATSGTVIKVTCGVDPAGPLWTKSAAYTYKLIGIFNALPDLGPEHVGMRLKGPAEFRFYGGQHESTTSYLTGPATSTLKETWRLEPIIENVNTNFLISAADGGTLTTVTMELAHTRGSACQTDGFAQLRLDSDATKFTVSA